MSDQKLGLIFATSLLSGVAVIVSIISLVTENWVVSQAEYKGERNYAYSEIKYGLFSGTFKLVLNGFNTINYEIKMTCFVPDNNCALLCGFSEEIRQRQLRGLIRGDHVPFDVNCPHIIGWTSINHIQEDVNNMIPKSQRTFINSVLYISTVCSLILSVIFGSFACMVSFWNTIYEYMEKYLGVCTLYIYNSIAAFLLVLTLSFWGAQFGTTLNENVAVLLTIQGFFDSRGLSKLGYSYWLLLPSLILYLSNISILFIRQYLIEESVQRNRNHDHYDMDL